MSKYVYIKPEFLSILNKTSLSELSILFLQLYFVINILL